MSEGGILDPLRGKGKPQPWALHFGGWHEKKEAKRETHLVGSPLRKILLEVAGASVSAYAETEEVSVAGSM